MMGGSVKTAPSILSADSANPGAQCAAIKAARADVLGAGSVALKGGSTAEPAAYAANIAAIRAAAGKARQAA